MTDKTRSATAYDKLAILNGERDKQHQMRYAWVKTKRQCESLISSLKLFNMFSPDQERLIGDMLQEANFQRAACWTEITRLDTEIDTLTAQLNNGVYDDETA